MASTSNNKPAPEDKPEPTPKAPVAVTERFFVPSVGVVEAKDQADLEAKVKKLSK